MKILHIESTAGVAAMIARGERALAVAKDHPLDAVVMLRLDRFIRNAEEGIALIKKLEKAETKLILVRDAFMGTVDTSNPMGEFFLRVVLALGELERKQTALRVKEGIARRMHEGKGWGHKARTDINTDLALELLKVRRSLSAVAKELGIPRSTLRRHFESAGVDYETYLPCPNTPPLRKAGGFLYIRGGRAPNHGEVCEDRG